MALKVNTWRDTSFLLQAMVTYQAVNSRLTVVTHDFTRHRARGVAVEAAARVNVHGDEFMRSADQSSKGSSFLGTATFFSTTYFGMPFLYGG